MKRVKIINVDEFTKKEFNVNNGEVYNVDSEGKGEKLYGYCITTVEKRAIVMYAGQVEVIENQ